MKIGTFEADCRAVRDNVCVYAFQFVWVVERDNGDKDKMILFTGTDCVSRILYSLKLSPTSFTTIYIYIWICRVHDN